MRQTTRFMDSRRSNISDPDETDRWTVFGFVHEIDARVDRSWSQSICIQLSFTSNTKVLVYTVTSSTNVLASTDTTRRSAMQIKKNKLLGYIMRTVSRPMVFSAYDRDTTSDLNLSATDCMPNQPAIVLTKATLMTLNYLLQCNVKLC